MAALASHRVSVHRLGSSEVIELDVAPESLVRSLKHQLAEICQLPPGSQELVHEESVLGDEFCLREVLRDGEALALTLVVSNEKLEKAYEKLATNDKLEALETLREWFSPGTADMRAIQSVLDQLDCYRITKKPGPSAVQSLAAKVLADIVRKGDEVAVTNIIERLESKRGPYREIAFSALPRLVERGDERALQAVCRYLTHDDESVREMAFASMAEIAGKDNSFVIAEVIRCLSRPEPGVRESAALSLGLITSRTDEHAIEALKQATEDSVACVKRAAAQSLDKLCMS